MGIKIGADVIQALYIGERKIVKAYAGEELVFGAGKPSRLPAGYTEVEYVQSSYTPKVVFRTGIKPDGTFGKIIGVFCMDSPYSVSDGYVFGGAASSGSYYIKARSAFVDYRFSTSEKMEKLDVIGRKVKFVADWKNKQLEIDGNIYPVTSMFQPTGQITIFSYTTGIYRGTGKVYSLQIYTGDNLQADFVPCITPDGIAGLYDIVRKVFLAPYQNAVIPGPAV